MLILGFVGPKGSGKDTAADILKEMKAANGKLSFAGPLKEVCSKVFNIPLPVLNDPDLKEMPFEKMKQYGAPMTLTLRHLREIKKACQIRVPEFTMDSINMKYNADRASITGLENRSLATPREVLQIVGTDYIRNRIYQSWHLEAAFSDEVIAKLSKNGVYCVTDIRFPNEYEFLKAKFGDSFKCYYVERPEKEAILAQATHASELGVKEIRALIGEQSVLKNDGTLEDFKGLLQALLNGAPPAPKETTKQGSRGGPSTTKSKAR